MRGETAPRPNHPKRNPAGRVPNRMPHLLPPSRPTVAIPASCRHPHLRSPSPPMVVIPTSSRHSGASRNLTCAVKRLPGQTTPKETQPATPLIGYLNLLPPSPTSDTAGSQVGQIIRKGPSAPVAAFTARLGDYRAPAGSPRSSGQKRKTVSPPPPARAQ